MSEESKSELHYEQLRMQNIRDTIKPIPIDVKSPEYLPIDKSVYNEDMIKAMNNYYKLKNIYETKYKKSISSIRDNELLSLKQKKNKIKALKPKCIKCKRNVGTLFSLENRVLIAKCGDEVSPCPLDIQIDKGAFVTETKSIEFWNSSMSQDKNTIIKTKLDYLFGFNDEKSSVAKFDELKGVLKETIEEFTNSVEAIDNITNNSDTIDAINYAELSLSKYIRNLEINKQKFLDDPNEDLQYLYENIEVYIKSIMPLLENIRNLKYQYFNVETEKTDRDEDIYYLIKRPVSIKNIERVIEDPKIISYKI